MEQSITIAIYVHAFFGGIGLIAGTISFLVKKGSKSHLLAGKWFSIGMIISSLISIPVAWIPGHKNMFLFLIALFTIYLVLAGNRALTFKPIFKKTSATLIDKLISGSMMLFAMVMIGVGILGLIQDGQNAVLFLFFGLFGLGFAIKDFRFYKNPAADTSKWLVNHLARIIGAYIASITAFMVAGLNFDNLAAWMLPTLIGTGAIIYWTRRVGKRKFLRPRMPKTNNLG
ncbi:hypothetical protein [Flavimarina sp. Hel_I_48]|uniref:hypothetical protein n=1 Tax=Flavimarina sp. Hel_I_48 TaxID=1392488 RepID=UPI00068E9592|nr:hypothetical protein [Flavimarina sp. Hel_I_48]